MRLFILLLMITTSVFADDCVKIRESSKSDSKSFNIVFVPSGFNEDLGKFEEIIRSAWTKIESEYTPFETTVDGINVILVKAPQEAYCKTTGDLLDCDYDKAIKESKKCFSSGKKVTITLHNSEGKFIRGNTRGDHVMMTNHPNYIQTITHELGHAIFSLADEYDYGGAADQKNCSSATNKCSEWQDMIDAGLSSCVPGCKNKASFVDGKSIMGDSSVHKYGQNNQRIICCRFKKMTGSFPGFCEDYRNIGEGIEKFCRSL